MGVNYDDSVYELFELKKLFGNRKNFYKYLEWSSYYADRRNFMRMGIYFLYIF